MEHQEKPSVIPTWQWNTKKNQACARYQSNNGTLRKPKRARDTNITMERQKNPACVRYQRNNGTLRKTRHARDTNITINFIGILLSYKSNKREVTRTKKKKKKKKNCQKGVTNGTWVPMQGNSLGTPKKTKRARDTNITMEHQKKTKWREIPT